MLYFKIPNALKINAFLKKQKKLALTYEPVRGTQMGSIRDYDNDFIRVTIGKGRADFEAAKAKMRAWQMFPPTWTKIMPENAPIKLNTNVAMFARFGGLWWRNACRIVFITDIPRRFGFAYGTLPSHMEYGEEFYLV